MDESELSARAETRRQLLRAMAAGGMATTIAGCNQSDTDGDPETDATTGATTDAETRSETTASETTESDPEPQLPEYGACSLGEVELDEGCEGPEVYDSEFSADTTIGADCSRAVVRGFLGIAEGATVTVEPGTRVEFEENAGIEVGANSALHATGTCADPILFTGVEPTRGHWRGVAFDGSNQPDNVLEHVIIEYGGGPLRYPSWERDSRPSNLLVRNARVAVERCTLRAAPEYGATVVGETAAVDRFESTLVTENGVAPVFTEPRNAHHLSAGSSYAGNSDDHVHVEPGTISEERSVTWENLDARYVPRGRVELDGDLEIAAGTTVSFGEDAYVYVNEPARLRANGLDAETEEVDEILFTAEDERRGHWRGLIFWQANQSENVLRNVTIEYAGGRLPDPTTRAKAEPANVTAFDARLSVDDCTIRDSAAWGVSFRGHDAPMTVGSFNGNTLTSNAEGAAYVTGNKADVLSSRSTYVGNDDDRVLVEDAFGLDREATWDAIDARYVLDGTVDVNDSLTVAPGTVLSFMQDAALYVNGGTLNAVGIDPDTEAERGITFTAEDELPGFWKGIVFDESFSSDNVLRNVVVEYGGGELWNPTLRQDGEGANVVEVEGSRVVLEDSAVRNSGGHGVWVDSDSELVESGNNFTVNTGESIGRET